MILTKEKVMANKKMEDFLVNVDVVHCVQFRQIPGGIEIRFMDGPDLVLSYEIRSSLEIKHDGSTAQVVAISEVFDTTPFDPRQG